MTFGSFSQRDRHPGACGRRRRRDGDVHQRHRPQWQCDRFHRSVDHDIARQHRKGFFDRRADAGERHAPAWIITDSGGSASSNPYNFVTYGANGYVAATYTDSGSGSSGGIRTATATSIVDQTGNATLAADAQAYALKVNDGSVITATGFTITLGNGTNPAGLIMDGAVPPLTAAPTIQRQ